MAPTSRSSRGSEGSTSRSRPSPDSGASRRSRSTAPVGASSSDGGRMSPDGTTSGPLLPTPTLSDLARLLPTPKAADSEFALPRTSGRPPEMSTHLSTAIQYRHELTSSVVDSHANPSPPPGGVGEPRTSAGSGRSSPVFLASYDPATRSWRTSQVSLLSTEDERFPRSWETWPRWGMTRRGVAFALPTSALRTGESASSSLPTPTASDATHGGSPTRRASTTAAVKRLLPTARTSDAHGPGHHGDGGPDLRTSIGGLMRQRSDGGKGC